MSMKKMLLSDQCTTLYNSGTESQQQRGFGLVETLIAAVVISIAVIATTQMTIGSIRTANSSNTAVIANDISVMLIERMRSNDTLDANVLAGYQSTPNCSTPPQPNCNNNSCTPVQIAAHDIHDITCTYLTQSNLPNSSLSITNCSVNNARICDIGLSWRGNVDTQTRSVTFEGVVL